MKTFYLIDYENLPKDIVKNLCEKNKNQNYWYLVFYSDKTAPPQTILETVPESTTIRFQYCYNGTDNALDFQLIATVAQMSAKHPNIKYIIISDDKGYTPAVRMLQEQGLKVFLQDYINVLELPKGQNSELIQIIKDACIHAKIPKAWNTIYHIVLKTNSLKEINKKLHNQYKKSAADKIYLQIKRYYDKNARK